KNSHKKGIKLSLFFPPPMNSPKEGSMQVEPVLHFGSFSLDLLNERLWCGAEPVPLRPKPFLLLRYLVEHADRLVSKTELLRAVWPDTTVSAEVLKGYV